MKPWRTFHRAPKSMTLPVLNVVRAGRRCILDQLRLEEALLRAGKENFLLLSEGLLEESSVVLGLSSKPDDMVYAKAMQDQQVRLIRRFSGGGTVFVDKNTLFVSLICNSDSVDVSPFPRPLMDWVSTHLYTKAMGERVSNRENDLVCDGVKFGGNAQSLVKGRWLHHTSILWDMDIERMTSLLKLPNKQPEYREGRTHEKFLTTLKHSGLFDQPISALDSLENSLEEHFTIKTLQWEQAQDLVSEKEHRKATHVIDTSNI